MLGTWTPPPRTEGNCIDTQELLELVQLIPKCLVNNEIDISMIGQHRIGLAQSWIKQPQEVWHPLLMLLSQQQMMDLAHFYVISEMTQPGFEAGDKSPAIWVFRHLKSENNLPDKAVIRHLKSLTDNRFIPYGSVL